MAVLVIDDRVRVPLRELRFDFARSSGPGGQNVNKVATKAILRWNVVGSPGLPEDVRARFVDRYHRRITREGEFVLRSQRFRDRGRNVADCLEKLREMLRGVSVAPRIRRPTRPTRSSVERRLVSKHHTGSRKRLRRRPDEDD